MTSSNENELSSCQQTESSTSRSSSTLSSQENEIIQLYESRRRSVVYISTLTQAFNPFSLNIMEIPRLSGSGFVWDYSQRFPSTNLSNVEDHYIVTNNHVIDNQKEVLVTFVDPLDGSRQSYRAMVRGGDKEKDIAVLEVKINEDNKLSSTRFPPPLPIGNSSDLKVGQFVMAIGNPFGLDQTLTSGIVSGLGRQIQTSGGNLLLDIIQTDAAINPGNSGGPLLDSSGRLIGMNTAIYSTSGAFSGVGFAIPVDLLKVVVKIIIKNGTFVKPKTGIQFIGGYQARLLGIQSGLIVSSIQPGSAAEEAGLRQIKILGLVSQTDILSADIILRVDGKYVNTEADFLQAIYTKAPGSIIELTVKRTVRETNNITRKKSREIQLFLKLI